MKYNTRFVSALLLSLFLLAWLPSGTDQTEDETGPIADAGPSQTIFEGETASFDGSLSVGSQGDKVFSENIRVNEHDPLSVGVNSEPHMRVDGHGVIHVIWKDWVERKPYAALYYSRSADGGLSFAYDTKIVNVTKAIPYSDSLNPRFDIDSNGNIHVVWTSVDKSGTIPAMYYSKSSDNGSSFDEPRIVLTMYVTADLSVDGENNIHLLAHGLPWDLYHVISRNGGESFGEIARVNDLDVRDTSNIEPELSRMVVDKSGDIHVIWPGRRQGEVFMGDIFYSKSEDGGQSFSNNIKVHDETGEVFRIIGDLDVDSIGNPHVIWLEKNLTEDFDRMAYTKSVNKGKTFQNKTFVRDDRYSAVGAGFFTLPSITIGPDDVPRIAWTESYKSVIDCNVWFSEFDEAIGNFSRRILVTDHGRNDTMQGWQSLALDDDLDIHIVWMDTREGDIQIYYSRTVPGRVAIMSYEWDVNNVADSDGDGNYTNDVDGTGSTPAFAYGDDGTYMVTLKATDEMGATDYDTTTVTVLNVDPIVSPISYQAEELNASVMFRIAGEKWHDVEVHLFEDDVEIGYARLARSPGSPNDQMAFLADISVDFSKEYSAIAYYTPEDDPVNGQEWGATPAWLILNFDDEEKRIHHTFNVRQEDTWVWNAENLKQYFPLIVTIEATAYDPGSDDLRFIWDFGDGTSHNNLYYNNGIGPDPPLSPSMNAVTLTDRARHTYSAGGTYTILLKVMDDDGGWNTTQMVLSL